MPAKPRKVHFVVSTHWDREWYEPFQGFRHRLVSMLDELLDTMDRDARFAFFQTDGQSILLEDYLEIRPERRNDIVRLAGEGRLEIGPWYVLPDEFLVSGESLIRNLLEGNRVSSEFGPPSTAGFVADIFGHNSQVPQLMRGFGIDNFFLWRGTNEKDRKANFRWRSPDGSEVLTFRFGPIWGYCDYAFRARKGNLIDAQVSLEDLVSGLIEEVRVQIKRCPTNTLLVFDGGDHMEIDPRTPDAVEEANRRLAEEGIHVEMSTLSRYLTDLRAEASKIKDIAAGELRAPADAEDEQWLIPGVLSSRIHLKQANRRCEDLLCYWAEPFAAIARSYGLSGTDGFLRAAWRHLLQNHPHDSICGCSVDQVHKDMVYRFDQCEAIAEQVLGDSLKRLALRVPGEVTSGRFPVVVANPHAFPVCEPVDLVLEIPNNGPEFQEFFGFERKSSFRIVDAKGVEIPHQRVHQLLESLRQQRCRRKFPHALRRHLLDVTLPLDLPPLGTRTLFVEAVPGPTRHPEAPLATGVQSMENEFLSVSERGGQLWVHDKETGAEYMGLLTLEDRADIGDGWYHGVAVNDEAFLSSNSPSTVVLVQNGPYKATWRIEVEFRIPSEFDFSRMVRSSERTTLRVTHWVTLRRGARRLEVVSEVENNARDHRLRVLFPSLIDAKTYWSDTPFDAVERPIALRKDNHLAKELEVETKPQHTWTAVSGIHQLADGCKAGLGIVSKGLPESGVIDDEDRTIALTLLRAFRRAVFTDGSEGGQIQGKHRFEYWIVPFGGRVDPVELGRHGQRLAAGIRSAQAHPLDDKLEGPDHPDGYSLLEVEGEVLVTSARGTGQTGLLVRLYNPKATHAKIRITMRDGFARAARCDLRDRELETLRPSGKKLNLVIEPKKIVTLLLEPRGAAD